jgi:Xaa-Pro aminopeptidase
MENVGVNAYVVPSGDPHLSEYAHPTYERRAFISSFTGSAGTALVTAADANLWTDGRYFLQAEQELGPEWTLMRSLQPGVPSLEEWLAENLPDGAVVGIDPLVHSVDDASKLETALSGAGRGLRLKPLEANLVDAVWANPPAGCAPRPSVPTGKARQLPLEITGVSCENKLATLATSVRDAGADAYLAAMLDEVCWLFNLRGSDVPCCPVVQAYAVVHCPRAATTTTTTATLYVDESKIEGVEGLSAALAAAGVTTAPYDAIDGAVRELAASGAKIMLDPDKMNYGLKLAAGDAALAKPSPVTLPKAKKNAAELGGMLGAHLEDGAALAQFFAWLRRTVVDERTPLTEVEIATKLRGFRAARQGFLDLSFPTICGVGSNGAIIHYNPMEADPALVHTLDGTQMMLLDSGGQYATGTTDVTRTIHLGEPTAWQRECFTRVLQGNIGLSTCVFPEGTPGMAIDAFARAALWQAGLDYLHGTGHGVGAALNVHEGPQSISTRYHNTQALHEGMICSNEPGYYENGGFGIRIENLLVVAKQPTPNAFNGKDYLGFDPLTHVPIQASLIEPSLLAAKEVQWLDAYHARVWENISPKLDPDDEGYAWLRQATRPLAEQLGVPLPMGGAAMGAGVGVDTGP